MDSHSLGDGAPERPAFLQSLIDRIHTSANAETVFGASREEAGRSIIPVARVWYGLGGGRSITGKKDGSVSQVPDEGGGGGITVTPVGIFELTESGTRFVPVATSKFLALGAFPGGVLLGTLMRRVGHHKR